MSPALQADFFFFYHCTPWKFPAPKIKLYSIREPTTLSLDSLAESNIEQLKWASFVMCGATGTKLKRLEPHFDRTWVFCVLMSLGPGRCSRKGVGSTKGKCRWKWKRNTGVCSEPSLLPSRVPFHPPHTQEVSIYLWWAESWPHKDVLV